MPSSEPEWLMMWDNRSPGGTAQRSEAAIALAEPPHRVRLPQPHIRHVLQPVLHI
jgi:hypothetical protein